VYEFENKINMAVFPALQGGPHNHQIAALATALLQVQDPSFKVYAKQVKSNAAALGKRLMEKCVAPVCLSPPFPLLSPRHPCISFSHYSIRNIPRARRNYKLVTSGTDNHLVLWDLRPEGISGNKMEKVCEMAHITLNKNAVFGDASALSPGGVRIGAPAMTSRGLLEADFEQVTTSPPSRHNTQTHVHTYTHSSSHTSNANPSLAPLAQNQVPPQTHTHTHTHTALPIRPTQPSLAPLAERKSRAGARSPLFLFFQHRVRTWARCDTGRVCVAACVRLVVVLVYTHISSHWASVVLVVGELRSDLGMLAWQVAEFLHRALQICLSVQTSHGKMLKDFVVGLENNKEIEGLCAEVEAYAQKFPMPGFEMSA